MDKKRGQVSVFVVIGLILLVIVSLWLYFQRETALQPERIDVPMDVKSVQEYVEQCLQKIAEPGAYLLAFNGGIFPEVLDDQPVQSLVSDYLLTDQRILPYLFVNGRKKSLDEITGRAEQHLSAYIQQNLPACTDFAGFLERGMFITEGPVRAETTISPTKMSVVVDYPLAIVKEEKTYQVRKFSAEIPVRLGLLLKIVDEVTGLVLADSSRTHLPAFSRISARHNVRITVLPYDQEVTVYTLYDNDGRFWIDGAPFIFWFSVKNSFSDGTASASAPNTPPQFANLKDFVLRKDALFEYQLVARDAEGDAVAFSSDTSSIPVSSSGLIRTVPLQRGTFFVTFTITDSRGLTNEKKARFVVE